MIQTYEDELLACFGPVAVLGKAYGSTTKKRLVGRRAKKAKGIERELLVAREVDKEDEPIQLLLVNPKFINHEVLAVPIPWAEWSRKYANYLNNYLHDQDRNLTPFLYSYKTKEALRKEEERKAASVARKAQREERETAAAVAAAEKAERIAADRQKKAQRAAAAKAKKKLAEQAAAQQQEDLEGEYEEEEEEEELVLPETLPQPPPPPQVPGKKKSKGGKGHPQTLAHLKTCKWCWNALGSDAQLALITELEEKKQQRDLLVAQQRAEAFKKGIAAYFGEGFLDPTLIQPDLFLLMGMVLHDIRQHILTIPPTYYPPAYPHYPHQTYSGSQPGMVPYAALLELHTTAERHARNADQSAERVFYTNIREIIIANLTCVPHIMWLPGA
eukprot:g24482.t1